MAVAAALAAVACGIGWYVQTERLEDLQAEYDSFVMDTEVQGVLAEERGRATAASDVANMEKANAENLRTITTLRADIKRLRAQRAGGGILPAAPATSDRAGIAAFDRAQLERALRELDEEVQGLVDEGSEAIVNLNSAREWARQQRAAPPP